MNSIYLTYDVIGDVLSVRPYTSLPGDQDYPTAHHSRELDFYRHLEYDKDDNWLGVVIIAASRGIDLRGVPEAGRIAEALGRLRGWLGNVIVDEEQQAAS